MPKKQRKILAKKAKKEVVNGREFVVSKERLYYVKDISKDFHAQEGIITKKDLKKKLKI